MIEQILSIALSMIVIPWFIWCTVSIFNQRQELALLRQTVVDIKGLLDRLVK